MFIFEQTSIRYFVFQESEEKIENAAHSNGLTTLNLRSNRLKGHIILGNYGVSMF